ncbi:GNAT family N-acetyltransferase [Paenibacillus sp. FSL W8-0426]|uniref:GNAT family N-acetyltransferase n=1 Tax=Paenibacillus sp. FSL W8-0426 TaxID=2921714 RepID=UPI0030DDB9A1
MVTIRKIEQQDLPALSQLYDELIGMPANVDQMERMFRFIAENEQYYLLGAFHEGKLAGSVMGIECMDLVGECRPFMVIENVIVSQHVRKQGVGQKLMAEIERIAKERNCGYMILVSGDQRKEAHRFYEKLGFGDEKVQGYRKHFD